MGLSRNAQQEIQEGLDGYYSEIDEEKAIIDGERKGWESIGRIMQEEYELRTKRINQVITEYIKEHPNNMCRKCYKECILNDDKRFPQFECRYIGLKIKTDNTGENIEIEKVQKGVIDELEFVPLTDKQLDKMGAIF